MATDGACALQRWPEYFAETTFLTDRFHGVNHLCSDEFKYNKHGMEARAEHNGSHNTSVSEQINSLMKRFDKTEQCASINTGMLVYDYFILRHNAKLKEKWPERRELQVRIIFAWGTNMISKSLQRKCLF
jgi:hypothetical protein